jgi:hypothetical protein
MSDPNGVYVEDPVWMIAHHRGDHSVPVFRAGGIGRGRRGLPMFLLAFGQQALSDPVIGSDARPCQEGLSWVVVGERGFLIMTAMRQLWRKCEESAGRVAERGSKVSLTIFTYSPRSRSVRAKNEGERQRLATPFPYATVFAPSSAGMAVTSSVHVNLQIGFERRCSAKSMVQVSEATPLLCVSSLRIHPKRRCRYAGRRSGTSVNILKESRRLQ